jgi:hypothetical protein
MNQFIITRKKDDRHFRMSYDCTRLRLMPYVSGSRPRDLSTTKQKTYHMKAASNQTPGYTKRNGPKYRILYG